MPRRNTITRCVLLIPLTIIASLSVAASFQGNVVKVSDGDTITVLREGESVRVRLGGIDAPEKDQPFGQKSRKSLAALVAGKRVTIDYDKTDRYGRIIGKVLISGKDANLQQVRTGMAHWYEYYKADQSPADRRAYREAEQQARSSGIGLWSDPHPIDPYDWRKGRRGPTHDSTSHHTDCGDKNTCRQMSTCAEAKFYSNHCGLAHLDGDSDGTPCEALCNK